MLKIVIILSAVIFVTAYNNGPWSDQVKLAQDIAREQINILIKNVQEKLNLTPSNEAIDQPNDIPVKSVNDQCVNNVFTPTSKDNMTYMVIFNQILKLREEAHACSEDIKSEKAAVEAKFCLNSAAATATWLASQIP